MVPANATFFTDRVTNVARATIDGYSEQSAFGNTVRITLFDLDNPTNPVYIGGFDGTQGDATDISANQTNSTGQFAVQITSALADGVHTIGVQATDDSGTKGNMAEFTYTLVTATPPTPTIALDSLSDSGVQGDHITNVTDPTFDIGNVGPNDEVDLFRNGTLVASQVFLNGGNVELTDPGPVTPDGVYTYTVEQIDVADNVSSLASLNVRIKTSVATPTTLALDPSNQPTPPGFSDSGRSNSDGITNVNDPVIDVAGVEPGATVQLFRNGTLVNTVTTVNGGTVPIQDGSPTDTVPDGTYIYTAVQTDVAGNVSTQGGVFLDTSGTVVINTAIPTTPPAPVLDKDSDSGVKGDDITNITSPTFDVTGIVRTNGIWNQVVLLRNGQQVNQVIPTSATSPVLISDPGPLSPDGTYVYTVEQVDVAGNVSQPSAPLSVTILTATPPTPSNLALDPNLPAPGGSDSGVKGDDITNITSPFIDLSGILPGATVELFRSDLGSTPVATQTFAAGGTVAIQDPSALADGMYTYTAEQIDVAGNVSLVSAGLPIQIITTKPAAPTSIALDSGSNSGRNASSPYFTNITSPVFDLTGIDPGSIVELFRDGGATPVASQMFATGGAVTIQDLGPVPVGTHTYTAEQIDFVGNISPLSPSTSVTIETAAPPPNAPVLDPASDSGVKLDNITNNTSPTFDLTGIEAGSIVELFRDGGSTPVTTQTFTTVGPNGAVMIQDLGPVPNGTHTYTVEQIDLANNTSLASPSLTVTIDKIIPPTPSNLTLDPASDSGVKGDDITNVKSPSFDLTGILPGATVELFRNGAQVKSVVFATVGSGGAVTIQDPGPAQPDGTYTYTAEQIDVAGNMSAVSTGLPVTILTATPPTPTTLTLDSSSDSGVKGDDITNITKPTIDVAGILPKAQVLLFRNGVQVNDVTFPAGGAVGIQDPGPVQPDGTYTYTVEQIDVAGNKGLVSGGLKVTILTATPATPSNLALDSSSDSGVKGDDITNVKNPVFDLTGILPGATVELFRNGVQVKSVTSASGGAVTIQDPGPVSPDGVYTYTAEQIDVAGNPSAITGSVPITIVTALPPVPLNLTLDTNSDSGVKGDDITNSTSPVIDLTGIVAGESVQLFRNGVQVNTKTFATVGPGGSVSIQDPGPVQPDGGYIYGAKQVDVAGNTSFFSSPLGVTIIATRPLSPNAPALDPGSDSGVKGDNITNVTTPIFIIAPASPTDTVLLLRDGVVVASRSGPGSLQDPGRVPDGTHEYQAERIDVAGNVSIASSPLFLTIDTQQQPAPGMPNLEAGSDTSFTHNQRITSDTSPVFDVPNVLANRTVVLFRDGQVVEALTSSVGGTVAIRDPGPVPNGVHFYTALQVDVADNVSPQGPGEAITIDTIPPHVTNFFFTATA